MAAAEPNATWGVDFARPDATGGFVRLLRVGDRCWCWAYLVGPELGLVVMRDHDVAPPRRSEILDVRADGLWMELVCERPGEHWTIGLEAFAVRLDAPEDALRGEIGDRLPMGLDLEWETDGPGPTGSVHGELLVADSRIDFDGAGVLRNATPPETAWPPAWSGACRLDDGRWVEASAVETGRTPTGLPVPERCVVGDGELADLDAVALVPIPLGEEATGDGPVLMRALTRVGIDGGQVGIGWLEVLQSGVRI